MSLKRKYVEQYLLEEQYRMIVPILFTCMQLTVAYSGIEAKSKDAQISLKLLLKLT